MSTSYLGTRAIEREAHTLEVDGISFWPAAMVLWETRAKLHIVAESTIGAENVDREHQRATEAWAAGGRTEPLPEHPSTTAFRRLTFALEIRGQ